MEAFFGLFYTFFKNFFGVDSYKGNGAELLATGSVKYPRAMLKATVVIFLSIVLGVAAVMAIRSESRSRLVQTFIAGLAIVLLAIVLRPEKRP